VNHDGENVDRPSVSAQSECETLQQENQAYVRNVTKSSTLKVVLS
jgi:hypothetical protein